MKIEYYEEMLEQEAINKYLNMIANDYNGELAKMFREKYINKDKEIERLENIIKEVREKLLCYGETFDLKVHQEMQKELLKILDEEKV